MTKCSILDKLFLGLGKCTNKQQSTNNDNWNTCFGGAPPKTLE